MEPASLSEIKYLVCLSLTTDRQSPLDEHPKTQDLEALCKASHITELSWVVYDVCAKKPLDEIQMKDVKAGTDMDLKSVLDQFNSVVTQKLTNFALVTFGIWEVGY